MILDFLNANSLRNYPIQDGCSRVDNSGLFTIPNSLITDLSLCSAQVGDSPNLYISTITCNSTSLTIEISVNGTGVLGVFQATLPLTDYNTDFNLIPNASFPDATGVITLGSSDDLASLPYGTFSFSYSNTALLMRVYTPINSTLSWITFADTQGNINTLTGSVTIQGNNNVQFRNLSGVIYMDAAEGIGFNQTCPVVGPTGTPITTINGIGPDPATGNFTLIAGTCVSLPAAQYGLTLNNTCGEPCLGCTAIETLTTQVNSLESSVLSLNSYIINLQAALAQSNTLLGFACTT